MDEQEPKEQFEATDYDEKGNINIPPTPPETAKPKRPTVAGLKKELDALKDDVEESILGWLGELATRLDALEESIPILQHNQNELMKAYKAVQSDVDAVSATTEDSDISTRLDNQDAAIGALADALRPHLEELAATPAEPETEIEFAQPPVQRAGETADISDIGVVASVCQTMTDVLTITRALKEVPELTDAERNEILYIAGRASGVIITPGLRIRAGVKFTGA